MDLEQSKELTSTNRSCGFAISLRQPSEVDAQDSGYESAMCTTHTLVLDALPTPSARYDPQVSGDDFEEATPDPIPNSEVKLFGADGTAREAVWESRTSPGFSLIRLEAF